MPDEVWMRGLFGWPTLEEAPRFVHRAMVESIQPRSSQMLMFCKCVVRGYTATASKFQSRLDMMRDLCGEECKSFSMATGRNKQLSIVFAH